MLQPLGQGVGRNAFRLHWEEEEGIFVCCRSTDNGYSPKCPGLPFPHCLSPAEVGIASLSAHRTGPRCRLRSAVPAAPLCQELGEDLLVTRCEGAVRSSPVSLSS